MWLTVVWVHYSSELKNILMQVQLWAEKQMTFKGSPPLSGSWDGSRSLWLARWRWPRKRQSRWSLDSKTSGSRFRQWACRPSLGPTSCASGRTRAWGSREWVFSQWGAISTRRWCWSQMIISIVYGSSGIFLVWTKWSIFKLHRAPSCSQNNILWPEWTL